MTRQRINTILKGAGLTKAEAITVGFMTGYLLEELDGVVTVRHNLSTITSRGLSEVGQRNAIKAGLRSYVSALKAAGITPEVSTESGILSLICK